MRFVENWVFGKIIKGGFVFIMLFVVVMNVEVGFVLFDVVLIVVVSDCGLVIIFFYCNFKFVYFY